MIYPLKNALANKKQQACQLILVVDDWLKRYSTFLIIVFGLTYKFSLDILYAFTVSPMYAYAGLTWNPSGIKYIISTLLYLILFIVLPKKEKDVCSLLLGLQFYFMIAPMLSYYALNDQSTTYMLMVVACVLLQLFILRPKNLYKQAKPIHIAGAKNATVVIMVIIILVTISVSALYNGFYGFKAFDFKFLYEMRANAQHAPGMGYLISWTTSAIIPFFLVYSLFKKKYGCSLALLVAQMTLYMILGNKAMYFSLIVIIIMYCLFTAGHALKIITAGFALGPVALSVLYQLEQGGAKSFASTLNALISIRALFIPAQNKFDFYSFFSQYPKLFFSEGIIGKIFSLTYPYEEVPGKIIYSYQMGIGFGSNSNTGYLGDAYAQMGFVGMLTMSILFAALLLFVCRQVQCADNSFSSVVVTVFTGYIITLNDGALFTVLFSGGMVISVFLIFIYASNGKMVRRKN